MPVRGSFPVLAPNTEPPDGVPVLSPNTDPPVEPPDEPEEPGAAGAGDEGGVGAGAEGGAGEAGGAEGGGEPPPEGPPPPTPAVALETSLPVASGEPIDTGRKKYCVPGVSPVTTTLWLVTKVLFWSVLKA